MITANFIGDKITSTSAEAFSLYEKSRFGEKKQNKIDYSLVETLYLLSKNKLELLQTNKLLSIENFTKKARRLDKRIETKFPVYSNMRDKGYILKTALKFGADFRVYRKGVKPGEDHALWILYCVKEHETLSWQDFAAKNRVAHSTKKNLLIGIVDDEDDVIYYEVSWLRP
jgi:tRNA-intron endonuclease, archaea type